MDKFDKAIESLQNIVEYWVYRPSEIEAAKLAITVLKQQQEREHGCDYCKLGKSINGERDVCKVKIFNNTLHSKYSDDFYNTEMKINYCPMCGTDLRKAVAE